MTKERLDGPVERVPEECNTEMSARESEVRAMLLRYRACDKYIDSLLEEKLRWEEAGSKITPGFSLAPSGGGDSSRVESSAIAIADIETQIDAQVVEMIQLREEISALINTLKLPIHKNAVTKVFILGKRQSKAADEMGYSERQFRRILEQAINNMSAYDL